MPYRCRIVLWGLVLLVGWAGGRRGLEAQAPVTVAAPADPAGPQFSEPHFATDPNRPDRILLAAIVVEPGAPWRVRAFRSADGGATWTDSPLPSSRENRCFGDPWVAWGEGDTAYLACLTERARPDSEDRDLHVLLNRTDDAGASWREPLLVPGDGEPANWDHPVLRRGPEGDLLIGGTRSRRSADEFGFVRYRPDTHDFGTLRTYAPPDPSNENFGASVPLEGGVVAFTYFTMRRDGPRPLWAVRLTAGNEERVRVRDHVTPWGFPMLAGGPTRGPYPARLYAVWLESGVPGGLDVRLSTSDDSGMTWSEPVIVNDPAIPAFRARPQVAVSDKGIAVTWFDRRHAPDPERAGACGDVYARRLDADGVQAGPALRVTSEDGCPEVPDPAGVRSRWPGGGDYAAIELRRDEADLAWAEPGPTGHRIRFARVRFAPPGAGTDR